MNRIHHQLYITAEWISQYALSIEAPLQSIQGILMAPATMPIIFWQEFHIPWIDKNESLIHGSQYFSYKAAITEGMVLDCELALTKVERKAGRQGTLTLFTHELTCTCNGKPIVTAETVLIRVGDKH
ncbi:MaoC family dehydratase N-terminal domain-containing protein [Paenibacillus sp. Marseille-Q4541]|uniref:FAS1-like dehydratase domain-containing protein n=1 Tax=Paenibacillus sp. Marseille-Q4541 TaxID=2831522 RepID=UPI001BA59836|nr:MaoC family dehydratase N-terminal domain-containing protein [Paenibacillus sp. Marseille-Q4541]